MKRKALIVTIIIIVTLLLIACIIAAPILSILSDAQDVSSELEKQKDSVINNRPEGALDFPILSDAIEDVRMTVVPRTFYPADYLGMQELYKDKTILQVWYGYRTNDAWHDVPSENYALIGILEDQSKTGWTAARGSHMVKIGPYLLICVSPAPNADLVCEISDTLGTPVQEPFSEYFTYYSYMDANGKEHFFMDSHQKGYGKLTENPAYQNAPNDTAFHTSYTFSRHYYLVLDLESLPENYALNVTYTTPEEKEKYVLTYEDILTMLDAN